ncbi:hypothetical protein PMZ80_008998 [Knufia obscura]|uniref:Haloacid dehalogenase-like hydrolase n=2 Tax=Knufia TaxID=430999 RepID=A0AAN8EIZ1_9EURO|nr:hypothetical protein PMZ80_008998 [Knufia obscura]KAK5955045.1 hypothetical protein OHC33_003724 [Knufia fluminis]
MGAGSSKAIQARPGIVVTLDALGTIYKFREPITTQYIKVARRCGLKEEDIRTDDLGKAFLKSFKEISEEYPNYGKNQLSSPRAWWKTVVNDAFRRVVDEARIPDHLGDELYNHFTSSAAYELYPDVKPFFASMRELKQQYTGPNDPPVFVGVISNSDPRVKSVLQSLGLRVGIDAMPVPESARERASRTGPDMSEIMKSVWHHAYNPLNDVDFLATSYEASAEKPDPEIFSHAATLANVNFASKLEQQQEDWTPSFQTMKLKVQITRQMNTIKESKFIHIGDDYEKDYLGAADLGFDALHLVREGDGHEVKEGANTVTDLYQAAAAVRIMAAQELEKSDG